MASTFEKKFKTTETTKAADAEVVSEPIELSPRSKDHVLTVTADSSCTANVDVELEMSPDGQNWCPAVSRTTVVTSGSTTEEVVGNQEYVNLIPDELNEYKNKHARGLMNYDLSTDQLYTGSESNEELRTDAADFMHHRIGVNKSFNYSQWIKTSEAPTSTYKPVLFRHGGYDDFENTKTVALTDNATQNLVATNSETNTQYMDMPPLNATTSTTRTSASYNASPFYVSTDATPTQNLPDPADGFAISMWLYRLNVTNTTNWSFTNPLTLNFTDGSRLYFQFLHQSGDPTYRRRLRAVYKDSSGNNLITEYQAIESDFLEWQHVLLYIKGTGTNGAVTASTVQADNDMKLFLNGTELVPDGAATAATLNSSTSLTCDYIEFRKRGSGTYGDTGDDNKIDNLSFIRGSLDSNAIASIFANKNSMESAQLPQGTVLTALFKMGDGPNDVTSQDANFSIQNTIATNDIRIVPNQPGSTAPFPIVQYANTDAPYQGIANSFPDVMNSTSSFSISGWFKTSDTGVLFSNGYSITGGVGGLKCEVALDGEIEVITANTATGSIIRNSNTVVDDGEWHHIVVTKNTSNAFAIYIDGVLTNTPQSNTLVDDDLRGTNGFTLLGDGQENAGNPSASSTDASKLQASLSNWSIHSEVLNADAVKQLYSNGHVRNIKNLPGINANLIVSWWQLADTTSPEQDLIGNSDLQYQYPLDEIANAKYITGRDGSANVADWELSGTNKNVFATSGSSMLSINDAWSISMKVDFPRTSGNSSYNTFFSMFTNLPTNGAGIQLAHLRSITTTGYQKIRIGISDGTNYWYRDYELANPTNEFGHLVVVKNAGGFGSSTDPFTVYWENQDRSSTAGTIAQSNSSSLSWNGQTIGDVHISGYHKYFVSSTIASRDTGLRKIDNVACYPFALTSGQVFSLYNSSSYYDPNLISGATAIFRMGDGTNDANDEIFDTKGDTTRKFVKGGTGNETIVDLLTTDNIYYTGYIGPGPLTNSIVPATGATLVEDSINGNAMTLSITKNFDFVNEAWVSDASGDAAVCLSFNGFEEQAEYFALWKTSQVGVNLLDGEWHNIILSYRGNNDLAGNNVAEGDTVKFGPGPAQNLPFHWAMSFDGSTLTSLNEGSGADYVGGLNTLATDVYNTVTYNVGFNIYNRQLKYESSNNEEVYKPHAQFSAGIHEVTGVHNNNAFQGAVDETSFHSDCWWVDEAGTSINTATYNIAKVSTLYGNTTTPSNRGAGTDYPEGVPYPLLDPSAIGVSPGTNQYINPNKYDASTNPNGGLDGWWRWGDTTGDCEITINDAKDSADSTEGNPINDHDLKARFIVTQDRVDMSAQTTPESIFKANVAASSTQGSASVSFPNVVLEGVQSGVCNLENINSPLLQFVRVKWTGAGSCDLGEGKGEAKLCFTNRRKRR